MTRERDQLDLVIVVGMSGGGRSTAARALEDVGYYVVDGLPQSLVPEVAELAYRSGPQERRTAIVLDVRRALSADLLGIVAELRTSGFRPRVLFLDATDEEIVRRFESVRRQHPLQGGGRLLDAVAAERELLRDVRAGSDLVVDTTRLNVNQLRARIEETFAAEPARMTVTLMSFGFKYGLPTDADLVVDMRFLPNPHWVPGLRELTGQDAPVSDYVLGQPGALDFTEGYCDLLTQAAAGFDREGKHYVTVGVGCTGGKHRSVAVTEAMAKRLADRGLVVRTLHRDLGRE